MAEKIRNGQAEYGTVHVMEEEMRAAKKGVFETHSSEAAAKRASKDKPASARKSAKP